MVLSLVVEPFTEPQKRWFNEAKSSGFSGNIIHYCFPLGSHSILVRDADSARTVLTSNLRFPKKIPVFKHMFGDGLVTIEDNEIWKRHRRIIQPSFQTRFIKESLGSIVPELVERLVSYWKSSRGKEIDVYKHLSKFTLDVIGLAAFSHDFHGMDSIKTWCENGDQNNELFPVTDRLMVAMNDQFRSDPFRLLLNILHLGKLDWKGHQIKKVLDMAVNEVIENARSKAKKEAEGEDAMYTTKSLLETLFGAEDETKANRNRLNSEELRDEVKSFLVAGHETTSSLCTWCLFALCQYPDIQGKIYAEVMEKAPSPNDHEFRISMDLINRIPYFNAFIKEVLRFYPPVGIIFRETAGDQILNNIRIPTKTRIGIAIQLIHRHPDYWVNPEEFRPERWLLDEIHANAKKAFMPFSTGPRNCIGEYFATVEAKLIMVHLIRSFLFTFAPSQRNTKFTLSTSITTRTKPDFKMCARQRV